MNKKKPLEANKQPVVFRLNVERRKRQATPNTDGRQKVKQRKHGAMIKAPGKGLY